LVFQSPHSLYRPRNNIVICKDLLCASLHPPDYKCQSPEQCDYEVEYPDVGSSLGVRVKDAAHLNLTNTFRFRPLIAMGLITLQLWSVRNVIGHCLKGQGGGFPFFRDNCSNASFRCSKYYSPGLADFVLGGKLTGIKSLLVFDSGSSYTYFSFQPYHALISWMCKELIGKPLKEAVDDRNSHSAGEAENLSKLYSMYATRAMVTKTLLQAKGNACLGILNGTEVGLQNFNINRDISMQDWASPSNCSRISKSQSDVLF
ncbi:hypothetical protein RJ641_009920, partial [Dillenia turbinata]